MFTLKVENTEKLAIIEATPTWEMCTLTSVVRSQHAIGLRKRSVYHVPVLVNTIRPSELVVVFIQHTGFVFYRTL